MKSKKKEQVEVLGQTGVLDTVKVEKQKKKKTAKSMDLKTLFLLGLGVVAIIVIIIMIIMALVGNKVTVSFDTDGGSKIAKVTLKKGQKLTKPKDPTKTDYTFVEWQLDGKKYDFSNEVNKSMKLKAKWEIKLTDDVYTITFDTVGGSEVESQSVNGNGQVVMPEDPTKPHNKFIEWQLNGKKYDFKSLVRSDLTLTAVWEIAPAYTVKIDYNEGGDNYSEVVYEGNLVSKPLAPKKEGYRFVKWQKNGQDYDFETPVMEDFTLVATYVESKKYEVQFNTKGGSFVKSQKVEEGSVIVKPKDPTKDGYVFDGWLLNGNKYDMAEPVTEDMILDAKWLEAKKCTIKLVTDTAEEQITMGEIKIVCGSTITAKQVDSAAKTKCQELYHKDKCYSNVEYKDKLYDYSKPVNENITLRLLASEGDI